MASSAFSLLPHCWSWWSKVGGFREGYRATIPPSSVSAGSSELGTGKHYISHRDVLIDATTKQVLLSPPPACLRALSTDFFPVAAKGVFFLLPGKL